MTARSSSPAAEPSRFVQGYLQATGPVDLEADATLDSLAGLAAALLQTPAAYVTLVAGDRQISPGLIDLESTSPPGRTLSLQESICQFLVVTGEPLVIDDTRRDPPSERSAAVRDGSVLAYAGVPLTNRGGHVLGSLCVVDQRPRQWTAKQIAMLGQLARMVVNDIENRLAVERVASAEALGRRTANDAKALLEAVSDLVELAEQEDGPRLQRSAARARARSVAVEARVGELGDVVDELQVTTSAGRSKVDLGRTMERAVAGARLSTGTPELDVAVPFQQVLVTGDAVTLERALVHLVVSALHHKGEWGRLQVRLALEQRQGLSLPTAVLTLDALGGQVPAAELGRIVARFRAAKGDAPGEPAGSATLHMVGGELQAHSGVVSGRSSAQATSFRVEFATAD